MGQIFRKLSRVLFLLLLMQACGQQPSITSGVIYEKQHQPQRMITYYNTQNNRFEPKYVMAPETWTLSIKKTISGREYTRTIYVTQDIFERAHIGDEFSIDHLLERPNR
jgi:hypothetical protein